MFPPATAVSRGWFGRWQPLHTIVTNGRDGEGPGALRALGLDRRREGWVRTAAPPSASCGPGLLLRLRRRVRGAVQSLGLSETNGRQILYFYQSPIM